VKTFAQRARTDLSQARLSGVVSDYPLTAKLAIVGVKVCTDCTRVDERVVATVQTQAHQVHHPWGALSVAIAESTRVHEVADARKLWVDGTS
jgi:hypothetical protein